MRTAKELSARAVAALSKRRGMHAVGGVPGLYLQVKDPGRDASWVLRFMAGKRVNQSGAHVPLVRYMGLGSARTFPLGMARERARTQRALIDDDKDPLAARDEARKAAALATKQTMTFEQCAAAFIAMKRAGWKDDEWTGSLRKHVYPVFGNVPVQDVTTQLVLAALKPIWESRTETASKVRQRLKPSWTTPRPANTGPGKIQQGGRDTCPTFLPARTKFTRSNTTGRCHTPMCPLSSVS